jgi:hypothetical protein
MRIAAHVHSTWSYDGRWPLERLARLFRSLGYDALLTAEHDRGFDEGRLSAYRDACSALTDERFVVLPGIEYSDPSNAIHVLVWDDGPFLGERLPTEELVARLVERGARGVLAHPGRREAWRRFDRGWLHALAGAELWNRKYDGFAASREGLALLSRHPDLAPFVATDFHTARQLFPLTMVADPGVGLAPAALRAAVTGGALRARALAMPAATLARGAPATALRGAEAVRRRAARRLRR